MRILAVVNQKGGCGKTTTAINLAGVLASRGFRTLLVDMDPQGHCAAGLAIPEQRVDLSIGDAMLAPDEKPVDPARLFWRVMRNLDLAPSTLRLAALEAPRGDLAGRPDAEQRLKKVLARFENQYDACLIDCSPAIGLLAFNALVAAHEVIIPVETGFFSLQGANKQVNTIKSIGKRLGVAPVHRLLATIHDPSSVLAQDLLDELRRRFGTRVVPVVVRQDNALREAVSFGQPVVEYAPGSAAAEDYSALADWLIEHSLRAPPGAEAEPMEPTSPPPAAATPGMVGNGSSEPEIHVMPGVADLALAGATSAPQHRAQAACADALYASASLNTVAEPIAIAEPQISRAADIAARARRLQGSGPMSEPSVVTIAEPKPSRVHSIPPFVPPLPEEPLALVIPEARSSPISAPVVALAVPVAPVAVFTPPAPYPSSLGAATHETRACGAHPAEAGVMFRQPITIGRSVGIAADFNNWSPESTPLRPAANSAALEAFVPLDPGVYQYRLVIDGQWVPDAFNPETASNPFGGRNSVVSVPGLPQDLAPASDGG